MSDNKDHYSKPPPFAAIICQDDASAISEFTGVLTPFPTAPHQQLKGAEKQPIGHGAQIGRPCMQDDASTRPPDSLKRVLPSAPPGKLRADMQPIGLGDQVERWGMQDGSNAPAPQAFKPIPSAPLEEFRAAMPTGNHSIQMSAITLDSQLLDSVPISGGKSTKSNPTPPPVLDNHKNPPMAMSGDIRFVPDEGIRDFGGGTATSTPQAHDVQVEWLGTQDDSRTPAAAAAAERLHTKPAPSLVGEQRGIAETLPSMSMRGIEDCTPMRPPRQSVPLQKAQRPSKKLPDSKNHRSSKQTLLILEDQRTTKTVHKGDKGSEKGSYHGDGKPLKQPLPSRDESLIKAVLQANKRGENECQAKSFEEQLVEDFFHQVEQDEEAPTSVIDEPVGRNAGADVPPRSTTMPKILCVCLIIFFALVIGGIPAYFILTNLGDTSTTSNETTTSTSQVQQPQTLRLKQIQRSLPDEFNEMGQSMRWLTNDDVWVPPSGVEDVDSYWRERYALAELYFSTNGENSKIEYNWFGQITSGENWKFEHNWLSPNSVCDWSCCTQDNYAVECDDAGRVTLISFASIFQTNYGTGSLEGTLPVDIFESMTKLRHLNLDNNQIAGALPRLPESIEHVTVSNNRFTGTIEKSHFESLSRLTHLNLSLNTFSGSLPSLPLNIESFYAFQENYIGRDYEGFSGRIAKDYFLSLTKLTTLNLHDNGLVGSIPSLPSRVRQLELHGNRFTGSVPLLPTTVEHALLHSNQIVGTFPYGYFAGLSNLDRFYVASNRMRGSIPPLPTTLNYAWFQWNCFTDVSNAAQRFDVRRNGEAEYCNGT